MAQNNNLLGEYLRARRGQVPPTSHGLPAGPRRRVPGLRREEVASLAGLSTDYYIRLEQGRDRHPSPSVLTALADVLGLDANGRAHLERLASVYDAIPRPVATPEDIRPGLAVLLDQWTDQAVLLLSPYRDVVAANRLATAINPNFVAGVNLMREVFLDPAGPTTYPDWGEVAEQGVAALRASVGAEADDPVRDDLVAELANGSAAFRRLWARHDAREKPGGRQRFYNQHVGTIELCYESFAVTHADRQKLFVFFAADDSADARLLAALAEPDATH